MSEKQIPSAQETGSMPRKSRKRTSLDSTPPPPDSRFVGAAGSDHSNAPSTRRNGQNGKAVMLNASGGSVPVTEWDRLSAESRDEIEQLVAVLKSFKQGDFSVRLEYQKDGILSRAGELLNDILGLNEHMTTELVRVGKVVGRE